MSFCARRYCSWRDLFRLEFFTDRAREEIDGGMKPQDLGAFIDKDDGGEFTCGSVECKEEPQFLLSQTISDDPQAHVKSLEALHALCGN